MFDRPYLMKMVAWTGVIALTAGGTITSAHGQCEEDKLTASDPDTDDYFGSSVCISGDVVVIGAQRDDDGGARSGSGYVYRFDGRNWIEEAKLTASDAAAGDFFGNAVSITDDLAVIGAFLDDDAGQNSGSAYVFRFNGTNWVEEAKLSASDGAQGDEFGWSVAISGPVAVIGAWGDDDKGDRSGSVYVFRFDGRNWIEEAKLTAKDGSALDYFGGSVSIRDNVILIGMPGDDDGGRNTGSAHVFRFDGGQWIQEAKLRASDGASDDNFGVSVALGADVAVVGAPGDDDRGSASGSAYVFRFDGGKWIEEAKLKAREGKRDDAFGASVSISGDDILVGVPGDDDDRRGEQIENIGAVYVFRFDGSAWKAESKLTALDGAKKDLFGFGVSTSGDVAIIGARFGDDENAPDSGSVYVFNLPGCRCTGSERMRKPKCVSRKGRNTLTTRVVRGVPGTIFTIKLDSGESAQAFLNDKGHGKAKFEDLPSGPGEAIPMWVCDLPPRARQRKRYECP